MVYLKATRYASRPHSVISQARSPTAQHIPIPCTVKDCRMSEYGGIMGRYASGLGNQLQHHLVGGLYICICLDGAGVDVTN